MQSASLNEPLKMASKLLHLIRYGELCRNEQSPEADEMLLLVISRYVPQTNKSSDQWC